MLTSLKLGFLFLSLTHSVLVRSSKEPDKKEYSDIIDLFRSLYTKNYLEYENMLRNFDNRESKEHQFPLLYQIRNLRMNYNTNFSNSVTSRAILEEEFIDELLKNNIFEMAMEFLADHFYVSKDRIEQKEIMNQLWFTVYRTTNKNAFQNIILQEAKFYTDKYFKTPAYLIYNEEKIKNAIAINNADVIKYVAEGVRLISIPQKYKKLFIGLSPELEMAIYTVCSFLHPNENCQLSLVDQKFSVFVHVSSHPIYTRQNNIIDAYPTIID